mmetsp:Transcript_19885/g.48248  ORF Transcript_19885/g.48248 Transcript_19885/m.48248 type:complete len:238 (-) Transcript_19885:834-1547(-)
MRFLVLSGRCSARGAPQMVATHSISGMAPRPRSTTVRMGGRCSSCSSDEDEDEDDEDDDADGEDEAAAPLWKGSPCRNANTCAYDPYLRLGMCQSCSCSICVNLSGRTKGGMRGKGSLLAYRFSMVRTLQPKSSVGGTNQVDCTSSLGSAMRARVLVKLGRMNTRLWALLAMKARPWLISAVWWSGMTKGRPRRMGMCTSAGCRSLPSSNWIFLRSQTALSSCRARRRSGVSLVISR